MAGRRPKASDLKSLTGNPGQRPVSTGFTPQAGVPKMPSGLTKEARREWRRIVPLLAKAKVLSVIDSSVLAGYCESYALWRQAVTDVRKNGIVIEMEVATRNGSVSVQKKNPAVTVAQTESKTLKSFLVELGMTPSARTKVKVSNDGDDFGEGLEGLGAELDALAATD